MATTEAGATTGFIQISPNGAMSALDDANSSGSSHNFTSLDGLTYALG